MSGQHLVYRLTDRPTYRPTDSCKTICPLFQGGHNFHLVEHQHCIKKRFDTCCPNCTLDLMPLYIFIINLTKYLVYIPREPVYKGEDWHEVERDRSHKPGQTQHSRRVGPHTLVTSFIHFHLIHLVWQFLISVTGDVLYTFVWLPLAKCTSFWLTLVSCINCVYSH